LIGILIATHGSLAEELLRTAEQIIGPQQQVAFLSTSRPVSRADLEREARALVESVDTGEGVLIMVDAPGGTPANICLNATRGRQRVQVVSGVNLPMLLGLVDRNRKIALRELARRVVDAGRQTIANLTSEINSGNSGPSRSQKD